MQGRRYTHLVIRHTLGVVLAGGDSVRMGSDKALLRLDETTFVQRAVKILSCAFEEVIVAGGSAQVQRLVSVPVIPDAFPDSGPLAGLMAALEYQSDNGVFLLAADMPRVTSDIVRAVAEPAVRGVYARIAVAGSRDQPLCGAYGRGCLAKAMFGIASGDRSMRAFLRRVRNVDRVQVDDAQQLVNINTPAEYQFLTAST